MTWALAALSWAWAWVAACCISVVVRFMLSTWYCWLSWLAARSVAAATVAESPEIVCPARYWLAMALTPA